MRRSKIEGIFVRHAPIWQRVLITMMRTICRRGVTVSTFLNSELKFQRLTSMRAFANSSTAAHSIQGSCSRARHRHRSHGAERSILRG